MVLRTIDTLSAEELEVQRAYIREQSRIFRERHRNDSETRFKDSCRRKAAYSKNEEYRSRKRRYALEYYRRRKALAAMEHNDTIVS